MTEEKKEYYRNYSKTTKRKEYEKQYRQSEKRKAYMKEYNKKYREQHKEYYEEYGKKYHAEHREVANQRSLARYYKNQEARSESWKKYYEQNKERLNQKNTIYKRQRRKTDAIYKLRTDIRNLVNHAINGRTSYKKKQHTEEILGCSIEEFIIYLQNNFKEGMTLENHRTMAHRPYNTYIYCNDRRRSNKIKPLH